MRTIFFILFLGTAFILSCESKSDRRHRFINEVHQSLAKEKRDRLISLPIKEKNFADKRWYLQWSGFAVNTITLTESKIEDSESILFSSIQNSINSNDYNISGDKWKLSSDTLMIKFKANGPYNNKASMKHDKYDLHIFYKVEEITRGKMYLTKIYSQKEEIKFGFALENQ